MDELTSELDDIEHELAGCNEKPYNLDFDPFDFEEDFIAADNLPVGAKIVEELEGK